MDRKPVSWYAITREGQKTLKAYLDDLSALIAQVGKRP